ncbi:MAG: hypothetical protein IH986_11430 [Planctomycetes bacterium]|nr:hypothetical protein [Planctomycetota bacterium]
MLTKVKVIVSTVLLMAVLVLVVLSSGQGQGQGQGMGGQKVWSLAGNGGTDPSTDFLGTKDTQPLVIRTDNAEAIRIDILGNVGIGTTSPVARLHVVGDLQVGNDSGRARLFINGGGINQDTDIRFAQTGTAKWFVGMLNNVNDDSFSILASAFPQTDAMTITQNGNVGIRTANPSERLHVMGNIQASGTVTSGSSITGDTVRAVTGGFIFPDGTTQTTAAQSSSGIPGYEIVHKEFAGAAGFGSLIGDVVRCPPGKVIIGGGGKLIEPLSALLPMLTSGPAGDFGWGVTWGSNIINPFNYRVEVFAICADGP